MKPGRKKRGRRPDLYLIVALDKFLRRLLWRERQEKARQLDILILSLSVPSLSLSLSPPVSVSLSLTCYLGVQREDVCATDKVVISRTGNIKG